MNRKVTVRNFSTLTSSAALIRVGLYLGGEKETAEEGGFRFKVLESERHGTVVKVTEVEK